MGKRWILAAAVVLVAACGGSPSAGREPVPALPWNPETHAPGPDTAAGAPDASVPVDAGGGAPDAGGPDSTARACGTSERVLLAPPSSDLLERSSETGRTLVLFSQLGERRIRDTWSGRTTLVQGQVLGFSADESRVLLWMGSWERSGPVLELEAATGTFRDPVGVPMRHVELLEDFGEVRLEAEDGRQWLYSLRSTSVRQLSGPSSSPLFMRARSAPRLLTRDDGVLVLWDLAAGKQWRIAQAEAGRLFSDGSGVLYLDAEERVWGWTPEGGPVPLGRDTLPYHGRIFSAPSEPVASGDLLFVGSDGVATLWNVRTQRVTPVGERIYAYALADSGSRLALVRPAADGTVEVLVRDLASGDSRVVWRGEGASHLLLNASGSRLVFVETRYNARMNNAYRYVRLWDMDTGKEVVLSPAPPSAPDDSAPWVLLVDEGRLLQVIVWDSEDALYSTQDGMRRYVTNRSIVPGEGYYGGWGSDGVYYARWGAYMGPPDRGLFAWDPRTGVETDLGRGTDSVCMLGQRHLYQRDMQPRSSGTPAPLLAWTARSGTLEQLSPLALGIRCIPERSAALFLEDWQKHDWPRASTGTLVFTDVARGCRQPVGTDVSHYEVHAQHLVYETPTGVWRASYPRP